MTSRVECQIYLFCHGYSAAMIGSFASHSKSFFPSLTFILFVIFLGSGVSCLGLNPSDSLSFHSDTERRLFYQCLEEEVDLNTKVTWLCAVNPDFDTTQIPMVTAGVNKIVSKLRYSSKTDNYKRFSKDIFTEVHTNYLKKYEGLTAFEDIFENGTYNCVTATALFSLISQELNVPNVIREQPNHVFLVVDPNDKAIVIESTDPTQGVYTLSPKAYVDLLKEMKMVSADEIAGKTDIQVYNEYIGDYERPVEFAQLVGDLYHNMALVQAQNGEMERAFSLINKAVYLNDNALTAIIRKGILIDLFIATDIQDSSYASYFKSLLEIESLREDMASHVIADFSENAHRILVSMGKLETFERIYAEVMAEMTGDDLKMHREDITLVHNGYLIDYYWQKRDWKKCLALSDSSIAIRPNDVRVQSDLADALVQYSSSNSNSADEMKAMADDYAKRYPFLEEYTSFRELRVYMSAISTQEYFIENNAKDGFDSFDEFTDLINTTEHTEKVRVFIGMVYGQISGYFIRERKIETGKKWILDGLKLAPDNLDLQRRLSSVEDYERNYR